VGHINRMTLETEPVVKIQFHMEQI
jgi:hypothetical protein